jgi:hypothetical protein
MDQDLIAAESKSEVINARQCTKLLQQLMFYRELGLVRLAATSGSSLECHVPKRWEVVARSLEKLRGNCDIRLGLVAVDPADACTAEFTKICHSWNRLAC